ncbi:hypothetical protein DLJ53_23970 [Acuticoccus sediminis]|uniref:Uncharacterized protein n=1 Tax=Acuticoccus sediminis TaxID=2184697 RepID=A0A8B2NLK8_9HYPH|nr:hypothetical protein [Acuticoccus sediminis]RAH98704.1 hypothetical protein DLJ53_23970 [Acuticoccus sediminis]
MTGFISNMIVAGTPGTSGAARTVSAPSGQRPSGAPSAGLPAAAAGDEVVPGVAASAVPDVAALAVTRIAAALAKPPELVPQRERDGEERKHDDRERERVGPFGRAKEARYTAGPTVPSAVRTEGLSLELREYTSWHGEADDD